MIEKETVEKIVKKVLTDNDYFLVDVTVGADNKITVYVDKYGGGISLDECEQLHHKIYPELEKIEDNFELTVSSPGLTSEFKVWQQYHKNVGRKIEVLHKDGHSFVAKIIDADENQVTLQVNNKDIIKLPYDQIQKAKLVIEF